MVEPHENATQKEEIGFQWQGVDFGETFKTLQYFPNVFTIHHKILVSHHDNGIVHEYQIREVVKHIPISHNKTE